jgi:hypothetical protein
VTPTIDYSTPGPFTTFDGIDGIDDSADSDDSALGSSGGGPEELCRPVQALFVQPTDTVALSAVANLR